ncbi:type II secretion system protein GspG [Burkholderia lata]|uniref:type II secretion system protein GspG n=1 Tax=Burkholderia lata (strain ATCC 17760 / DSM 23089 / LMG 22485 / NCIMB 9086 / R18194 / 383) TaxID=482957 RepID=UPI0014537D4F|nr:type II secretion system protein GspG [Burkholderia lata]VWD31132.1 type II secretion system protein GspG [Burkholderia lata]
MANLTNSQRSILKATYVPTSVPGGNPVPTSRAVEKVAMVRLLNLQAEDFKDLAGDQNVNGMSIGLAGKANPYGAGGGAVPLLKVVESLTTQISSGVTSKFGPLMAEVSPSDLAKLAQAVSDARRARAKTLNAHVQSVVAAFQKAKPNVHGRPADALNWGLAQKDGNALHLLRVAIDKTVATGVDLGKTDTGTAIVTHVAKAAQSSSDTLNILNGFLDSFKAEPVGRLHLERIEMTPVGIEHGELVHSVPLTPQETVNITHREWSTTTQTFENIVSDSLTGYSETGVVDKTDISQATTNESRQQSSMDVNGNVSASYSGGGFSVTASTGVDYNTKSDDFKSVKDSLAHSVAVTRAASSRTRKDHRTSFQVSSVAGAENLAVQVLTNPTSSAIRVDYYQLMRKWKVDLIRYGLRMTYDIVVPNPGSSLAAKVTELYVLNQQIAQGYSFAVHLSDINTSNWADYEQAYGVTIDPPPTDPFQTMEGGSLQTSIDKFNFEPVDIDIPDGYVVTGGHFHAQVHLGDGDFNSGHRAQINLTGENPGPGTSARNAGGEFTAKDGVLEVDLTPSTIVGRTGHVSLMYDYYNVESGAYVLKIQASPTAEEISAWQAKVWGQLREADQAAFDANLRLLNDRKATLQNELNLFDALTLRRMEREEIMKSVLQWLFGPTFQLQPGSLDVILNDPQAIFKTGDTSAWQTIMQYGEYIKFIHNAIEWENVLFFPYPYFWDATSRWPFKLFLLHPDPEHRTFLRAGCARVVLTIRPGFEQSFAQFMENYSLIDALAINHPYVSIGTEIRNFAMTNYEAIPPANPDKNVRPLLYPEQRKAWSDMQKLILLIEDYNNQQHNITLTTAVAAGGSQTVTPSSMNGIDYGVQLTVDTDANQETVSVTAVTKTTFSAVFASSHVAGTTCVIDADVKLYPPNLAILSATVAGPLPLKDPWNNNYVYTMPGLHGDYDLVSFGKDGKPGGDDLDADITSWAEGSIVSTWYEYTPTSALDVVINSALTTKADPA